VWDFSFSFWTHVNHHHTIVKKISTDLLFSFHFPWFFFPTPTSTTLHLGSTK
jgi:hypothetical protein